MNLGKYLKIKDKTYKRFAEETQISSRSIPQYIEGEFSASLLCAIKIFILTKGDVQFIDLLSIKDLDILYKFLDELKIQEEANNSDLLDAMHKLSKEAIKERMEQYSDYLR